MPIFNKHQTLSDQLKNILNEPEMPDVNLRSEAVQDILGRPPRWMIRWGISVIFTVVVGLFVGSYFFKYPDIVSARVVINSEHLPANIGSKISGRIDSLFVLDGQPVKAGDAVALIQKQRHISTQYTRQLQSVQKQIDIAKSTFRTDSILYVKGGISASEYDQAKHNFLSALQTIENAKNATESQQINYGKALTFTYNMEVTAEIITEDLRLLDKFINPIKAILKR